MFHVMLKGYTVNGGILATTDRVDAVVTTKERVLDDLMDRGFMVADVSPHGFLIGKRRVDEMIPVGRLFVVED